MGGSGRSTASGSMMSQMDRPASYRPGWIKLCDRSMTNHAKNLFYIAQWI